MQSSKKIQLALREMCEFDDILTDALIDKVYYWTTIRKNRQPFYPNRKIKSEEVVSVITDDVIRHKDVQVAMEKFQSLSGIQSYMTKFGPDDYRKNEFLKHARRYLQIYHPEARFEVSSTIRYTLSSAEACVLARHTFKKGDTIRFLTAAMLKLTDEEEASLGEGTDFSIVCSSRMQGTSILLGPARFINHDCDPNCKFATTNKDNVTVTAIRDIEKGEEITVMYSDNYFGQDNCECLCVTCEKNAQNGFAPAPCSGTSDSNLPNLLSENQPYSFRSSKRGFRHSDNSYYPERKKRRNIQRTLTPPLTEASSATETFEGKDISGGTIPRGANTPISQSSVEDQGTYIPMHEVSRLLYVPGSARPTHVTPPPSDNASTLDDDQLDRRSIYGVSRDARSPYGALGDTSDSELSEMDDDELDTMGRLLGFLQSSSRKRKSKHPTSAKLEARPIIRRTPGDVDKVPRIGVECVCVDCHENFWHAESWFIPRSCQRCERHSKLYGYVWPKTMKRSKFDNEEEVQDPRTIVRFLPTRQLQKVIKEREAQLAREEAAKEVARASKRRRTNSSKKRVPEILSEVGEAIIV